jgi:predicted acetyltransferase
MAVADPLLPENNGLYQLKLTNGQPKVTLKNGGKPDLSCSVGALAGLLTGQARPQALIESGALTVYGKNLGALLDTVFPPTRNFVNEYF